MHSQTRRFLWVRQAVMAAALIALCGCVQGPARVAAASAAPVAGGNAQIWFYRDFEPTVSLNDANIALNGTLAASLAADGSAIYRDVAPGRYHVTVESYGKDLNQAQDVDLAPGQEGYVKILAQDSWESGGDTNQFKRDTFYVSLVPPQIARAELATHPLSGG